jgi:hypothetical protein
MLKIYRPPNPDATDERFAVDHGIGEVEFNDRGACWFEPQVPEGWVEMVPGQAPWAPLDRPVGNPGTHATHCCPKHGCKYGSSGCPVQSGEREPVYGDNNGCEQCEFEAEEDGDDEGPHI